MPTASPISKWSLMPSWMACLSSLSTWPWPTRPITPSKGSCALLSSIQRFLRPGGRLYVVTKQAEVVGEMMTRRRSKPSAPIMRSWWRKTVNPPAFRVFDYRRSAPLLGQIVAESVAAVAAAGLRRVVSLASLARRQLRIDRADFAIFPAELHRIVIVRRRVIGPSKSFRPGLRVQDVIDGRRRAVVEVGRRRPQAVQRWGLIALRFQSGGISRTLAAEFRIREPGRVIILPELGRDAKVPGRVRADLVECNDFVRIGP